MKPQLVIFDCDGVLVDSEPIANRVLAAMLNEQGLEISHGETMRCFVGRSMPNCIEIIERRLGRSVPADFVESYNDRSFEAFERELQPVAGIEEALQRISIPHCVASSASHEKMRTTLGVTRLLPRFEGRMFSATEVGRGKPDPALFLHAARTMGVPAAASAVVEDTVVGVQAARAAGMTAYAYAAAADEELRASLASEGARLFEAMARLPELLDEA